MPTTFRAKKQNETGNGVETYGNPIQKKKEKTEESRFLVIALSVDAKSSCHRGT